MALNSVNTNIGSMVALESLQNTQQELAVTQKQISTGYRVADSTDDGAAYAVAQGIRSTIGALTAANQQLGNTQGLLSTTQSGLNNISNTMGSMRDVLVKLSDSGLSANDRTNYAQQFASLLANVKTFVQDATYNGKTLIGDISQSHNTYTTTAINTVRNDTGATYGIASYSGSAIYGSILAIGTTAAALTSTAAAAAITTSGAFINNQSSIGKELNKIGAAVNYISNQVTYNSDKIDSLNAGLGALVDADLAKESAQLTALQIRQQLGTQALSLANQAPQSLLSLFK
jgi:flagellin